MELILGTFLLTYLVIILVLSSPYIIITGILLNKYNKLMYDKKTILAFIPFFRIYLIGKYAFSEQMGSFLVIWILLGSATSIAIPKIANAIYSITVIVGLIIIAGVIITFIKYFDLKKGRIPNAAQLELQKLEQEKREENKASLLQTYDAVNQSLVNRQEITTQTTQNINNTSTEKKPCLKCGQMLKTDIIICPFCGHSKT